MDVSTLQPEDIAALIARVLKERDPASVGLRRILRRKTVEGSDFPMRIPAPEEFSVPGKRVLSEDEVRILDLERSITRLEAQAKQQTENARRAVGAAYTRGYEAGCKSGMDAGRSEAQAAYRKETEDLRDKTAAFLKAVEKEKRAIYAGADRLLLDLCFRIVKKILSAEPTARPSAVLDVLRKALSYIAEKENIVIRVAPADLETVSGNDVFRTPMAETPKNISIEPDERIERGGCVIESKRGIVDARLGVQMDALAELIETSWHGIYATNDTQEAAEKHSSITASADVP